MENGAKALRGRRQMPITNYTSNSKQFRSPRRNIHVIRPGKKPRKSKKVKVRETKMVSSKLRENIINENLPNNNNKKEDLVMKKEEEEENVLMSKYQQDQHDDDENFTPLTEELLRNHTWKVNEDTNSTPSERAQDSITKIMNKNHQDQEYQNKLLDIAKKYKQTILKENEELLQSKISMHKEYEEQRRKLYGDKTISKYLSYINSFFQFSNIKHFSYYQMHALTSFLKRSKVIFGHDIFFGKAVTCMAAAYCIKHRDKIENIFMVAHEDRHADLNRQRNKFCGSIIELISPKDLAIFYHKAKENKLPYMLIAIDFTSIILDHEYQQDFFSCVTSKLCKKFIGTSNALYGTKEGTILPGNVRRLQNSFSKVVKQMIPFIKLTSTDPEKYLYEINSKTGDMEPSKKAINIVKRNIEYMYKNQRSDKDDDTYEMVKRKNIQLLLRHYDNRIIIKSRKDKFIAEENPHSKARRRVERLINLRDEALKQYECEIFKLSMEAWSKTTFESKCKYIKNLDKINALGKVNAVMTMLIYASMRGHSVLVVSKYEEVVKKLYTMYRAKGRACKYLLENLFCDDNEEKNIEEHISTLEYSLEKINSLSMTANIDKDEDLEKHFNKTAKSLMNSLEEAQAKIKRRFHNYNKIHSLSLAERVVFSTYDRLKCCSNNLKATGTPFVFLIDRPYTIDDVHMCENCAPDETNRFQSTSIWIQNYNTIDSFVDKNIHEMEANKSTESWISRPDQMMLPIIKQNEFVFGDVDF